METSSEIRRFMQTVLYNSAAMGCNKDPSTALGMTARGYSHPVRSELRMFEAAPLGQWKLSPWPRPPLNPLVFLKSVFFPSYDII